MLDEDLHWKQRNQVRSKTCVTYFIWPTVDCSSVMLSVGKLICFVVILIPGQLPQWRLLPDNSPGGQIPQRTAPPENTPLEDSSGSCPPGEFFLGEVVLIRLISLRGAIILFCSNCNSLVLDVYWFVKGTGFKSHHRKFTVLYIEILVDLRGRRPGPTFF